MKIRCCVVGALVVLLLGGCSKEPPPTNADRLGPFYRSEYLSDIALPVNIPKLWNVAFGNGARVHIDFEIPEFETEEEELEAWQNADFEAGDFLGYGFTLTHKIWSDKGMSNDIFYCVQTANAEGPCDLYDVLPEECEAIPLEERTKDCSYFTRPYPVEFVGGDNGPHDLVAIVKFRNVDQETQDFILKQPLTFDWEYREWVNWVWEEGLSYDELQYLNQ